MGVDARMAVRLAAPLEPRQINRLAGDMVATLGAERFYIRGLGMFSKDYPGEHALRAAPTLAEHVGEDLEYYQNSAWFPRWVAEARQHGWDDPLQAPVAMSDVHGLWARPGQQLLEVGLWGRYYGVGYERGHWPHYREVAEWLEHRLPGCEVFYGGDTGGLQRCDAQFRAAMDAHFYGVGHDPYVNYSGGGGLFVPLLQPVCQFCGDRPYVNSGGGQGKTFWSCHGCEDQLVTTAAEWWRVKRPDHRGQMRDPFFKEEDSEGRRRLSELRTAKMIVKVLD